MILALIGAMNPYWSKESFAVQETAGNVGIELVREHTVKNAHQGPILGLKFSDNGSVLVSSGEDGRVKVWDGTTMKNLRQFHKHQEAVTAISFQDDSNFITSSWDGTIRGWGIERDDEKLIIRPDTGYISTLWSTNERILYVADEGCFSWSISKAEKLFEGATALSLSHDNRFACVGLESGDINILSLATNEVTQNTVLIEGKISKRPSNLSWSTMGEYVSVVTWLRTTNELYIYDLANNSAEHVIQPNNPGISAAQFTPDGSFAICAGSSLSIVDVETKQSRVLASPPKDSEFVSQSFTSSPRYFTALDVRELDGKTVIVAGTADGDINRWTLTEKQ